MYICIYVYMYNVKLVLIIPTQLINPRDINFSNCADN